MISLVYRHSFKLNEAARAGVRCACPSRAVFQAMCCGGQWTCAEMNGLWSVTPWSYMVRWICNHAALASHSSACQVDLVAGDMHRFRPCLNLAHIHHRSSVSGQLPDVYTTATFKHNPYHCHRADHWESHLNLMVLSCASPPSQQRPNHHAACQRLAKVL